VSFRRLPSLGSILLLAVGIALLLAGRDDDAGSSPNGVDGQRRIEAAVVEVVDGDTARMRIDGREQSVRYIGIDTPESVIPGETPECFGKRSAGLNRKLVESERVTLVFGAERRDRYDRLLAYVYVGDLFVNAEIVRRGFARTLAIAPNTDFADRFTRLQQAAANAGRGLWGAC
jgi:micrococcal nuclease